MSGTFLVWVYFVIIFAELFGIMKYIILRDRFVRHTVVKTTFLVAKAFSRIVCYALIFLSSREISILSVDNIHWTLRMGWLS